MTQPFFKRPPRLCSLLARKSPLPLGEAAVFLLLGVILVAAWLH